MLARRWRHLWKFATSLHIERELEDDPESLKAAREFVDHLLLLREATHIDTCDLFFIPYGDELQNDDAEARIKLWIRHILKCKTGVLGVRFPFSCIYEMTLVSDHLEVLDLYDMQLTEGFLDLSSCPALTELVIYSCDLVYADTI